MKYTEIAFVTFISFIAYYIGVPDFESARIGGYIIASLAGFVLATEILFLITVRITVKPESIHGKFLSKVKTDSRFQSLLGESTVITLALLAALIFGYEQLVVVFLGICSAWSTVLYCKYMGENYLDSSGPGPGPGPGGPTGFT